MTGGRIKKSLSVSGHRTSIALEREFWEALHALAANEAIALAAMVSRIDAARPDNVPLSSALRLAALNFYRTRKSNGGA